MQRLVRAFQTNGACAKSIHNTAFDTVETAKPQRPARRLIQAGGGWIAPPPGLRVLVPLLSTCSLVPVITLNSIPLYGGYSINITEQLLRVRDPVGVTKTNKTSAYFPEI